MIRSTSHRHGSSSGEPRPSAHVPTTPIVRAAGRKVEIVSDVSSIDLALDGQRVLRLGRRSATAHSLSLTLDRVDEQTREHLELALGALFGATRSLAYVDLALQVGEQLAPELLQTGLAALAERREGVLHVRCERSMYFQRPTAFLGASSSAGYPLSYVMTGEKRHPRRPPRREGEVYRRDVAALDCSVSFRTLDAVRDLEVFHRWMNDPRVAAFWELSGTREAHAGYIATLLGDAHVHPVIGCFDDEPFGYFELYWAKEDRIAPFYQAHDYDRGLHMLVGEPHFRGPARVSAWLSSLVHFLFLDDPRTEHVVAEPRADNQKMIDYLRQAGFYMQKQFDFPHKRAAMMIVPRETFFVQYGP